MEKPCIEAKGYLTNGGYVKYSYKYGERLAHRAAWVKVHGPIPKGIHVRHLCHNKTCIEISHLVLGTAKENKADSMRDGKTLKGEQVHQARLTEEDAHYIREHQHESAVALAKRFEVSPASIYRIWYKETWKWLDS